MREILLGCLVKRERTQRKNKNNQGVTGAANKYKEERYKGKNKYKG